MSDKFFSQVMILAGLNGADGATSYNEESGIGRAATFAGNAQLDTAQAKWGASSLLLDGAGDALTFPDAADLSLLAQDFTVECWARFAVVPATPYTFVSHYSSGSNQRSWLFDVFQAPAQTLRFAYSTSGSSGTLVQANVAWSPAINVWYHVAASRISTNLRLFVDGVLMLTHNVGAASFFNTTAAWCIGAQHGSLTNPFNGWIDEVRLTIGRGRYSAAFLAPQGPFSRGKRLGVTGEGAQPQSILLAA